MPNFIALGSVEVGEKFTVVGGGVVGGWWWGHFQSEKPHYPNFC